MTAGLDRRLVDSATCTCQPHPDPASARPPLLDIVRRSLEQTPTHVLALGSDGAVLVLAPEGSGWTWLCPVADEVHYEIVRTAPAAVLRRGTVDLADLVEPLWVRRGMDYDRLAALLVSVTTIGSEEDSGPVSDTLVGEAPCALPDPANG